MYQIAPPQPPLAIARLLRHHQIAASAVREAQGRFQENLAAFFLNQGFEVREEGDKLVCPQELTFETTLDFFDYLQAVFATFFEELVALVAEKQGVEVQAVKKQLLSEAPGSFNKEELDPLEIYIAQLCRLFPCLGHLKEELLKRLAWALKEDLAQVIHPLVCRAHRSKLKLASRHFYGQTGLEKLASLIEQGLLSREFLKRALAQKLILPAGDYATLEALDKAGVIRLEEASRLLRAGIKAFQMAQVKQFAQMVGLSPEAAWLLYQQGLSEAIEFCQTAVARGLTIAEILNLRKELKKTARRHRLSLGALMELWRLSEEPVETRLTKTESLLQEALAPKPRAPEPVRVQDVPRWSFDKWQLLLVSQLGCRPIEASASAGSHASFSRELKGESKRFFLPRHKQVCPATAVAALRKARITRAELIEALGS